MGDRIHAAVKVFITRHSRLVQSCPLREKTLVGEAANLKQDHIVGVKVGASLPRKQVISFSKCQQNPNSVEC